MRRFFILSVGLALLAWTAVAQTGTSAQSQTSAGASSNTNVSAGQSGVNAQSNTSVDASQNTNAQDSGSNKAKRRSGKNNSAESNQTSAGSGEASLSAGTTLNAVLTKSIDSRKAKEGDEVTAKTTTDLKAEGQRTIPKGTKLVGHVTKASAKGKGDSDSSLGIIFDRAEVAKGREVPIHAVIQAVAATSSNSSMAMNEDQMGSGTMGNSSPNVAQSTSASGGSGGGGLVGGTMGAAGRTANGATNTVDNTTRGAVGSATGTVNNTTGAIGTSANSTLNTASTGVVGLPGYTLDSAASSTQGSVITSSGKNVKLDSGTQMVLRVVGQ